MVKSDRQNMSYSFGWFSTGRDAAARQLLRGVYQHMQEGDIPGHISFVFSNRAPGESRQSDRFFALVEELGLPLVQHSSTAFRQRRQQALPPGAPADEGWRVEYDREVMQRLQGFDANLHVLAGYMLIVGPEMCRRYDMLNLHPAAPGGPTGTWQEVIRQLVETDAEETGVMMHLATPELDQGPPVTYCRFPIRGGTFDPLWAELRGERGKELEGTRLFARIREEGLTREFPLLVATLRAFAQGWVHIEGERVLAGDNEVSGYDLTAEIERAVTQGREA